MANTQSHKRLRKDGVVPPQHGNYTLLCNMQKNTCRFEHALICTATKHKTKILNLYEFTNNCLGIETEA